MNTLSISSSVASCPDHPAPAVVPSAPAELTHDIEQVTSWGLPNESISVVEPGCMRHGRARMTYITYLAWCKREAASLREAGMRGCVRSELRASEMADKTIRKVKMVAVFAKVEVPTKQNY